ncbi:MAG: tetratricopeptide repeat protein [Ignavibacteriales bacterium]|nr:tetratricopeptide repeat protein [Ignavibacteriales bacterium]
MEEALKAYKKFLEIDPYSASGWYNFGIVHLKLSNIAEAINNFELAVALNDDFVNAWYNLGVAQSKTSHFIDARKSFFKAFELDPYDYTIPLSIAQTFEAIGEYEKAAQYFNESIQLNKAATEAYLGLGNFYARKNEKPEMIKYFALFVKYSLAEEVKNQTADEMDVMISEMTIELINLDSIENKTTDKLTELAELYFDFGRWNDAKEIYTDLLEKHFDKSEIFYGLALCNLMLNNNELAVKNLIAAFEINPAMEKIFLENFTLLESTQLYINIFNSIY